MHWLDDAYGWATCRPLFYADGWGDDARLARLQRTFAEPPRPGPLSVRWEDDWRLTAGVRVRHGVFPSPCAEELPRASAEAAFELILPVTAADPEHAPVCLHLAATGAQGYEQRRRIALPLVRAGIGALLLENPYYGRRRPPGQRGAALRTVADQLAMNRATLWEACALLAWLRGEGHRARGVTGFSMGGVLAALVAGACDEPIAAVPCAASKSMAPMMVDGVLGRRVAWGTLAEAQDAARRRLVEVLEATSVQAFPAPRALEAAIVWGARQDGFVPSAAVERLAAHWTGVEVRWAETGHVAGFLRHLESMRQAVRDAFGRLPTG